MSESLRSLRERWETPHGQELAVRVLAALTGHGELPADLRGSQIDGRTDVRGYRIPSPRTLRESHWRGLAITELAGVVKASGTRWRSLDFSGAVMEHLRMEDLQVENCRFDRAVCTDLRLWRCDVTDSSFKRADLRNSALGPWSQQRGNVYFGVKFSQADLRNASSLAATYTDCDFSNARLDELDFKSSSLIRCRFSGMLRGVVFDGRKLSYGKPDPNPMEDIDLTTATLQMVEFRGIDVAQVHLPNDSSLRIIDNYPCVLECALQELAERSDMLSRGLRSQLSGEKQMLVPGQRHGLFNRNDMFVIAKMIRQDGEQLASFAEAVLDAAEQACSR